MNKKLCKAKKKILSNSKLLDDNETQNQIKITLLPENEGLRIEQQKLVTVNDYKFSKPRRPWINYLYKQMSYGKRSEFRKR